MNTVLGRVIAQIKTIDEFYSIRFLSVLDGLQDLFRMNLITLEREFKALFIGISLLKRTVFLPQWKGC